MFSMERELYMTYKEENFEESALLLLEHIFRIEPSPEAFYQLLRTLFSSGAYEAIKWMCDKRQEYFEYTEVKEIYIESMKKLGLLSEIDSSLMISGRDIPSFCVSPHTRINRESVVKYYQTLINRGKENKLELVEAISIDERNLEALIYIYTHYSQECFQIVLESIEDRSLYELYSKLFGRKPFLFSVFSNSFFSPVSCIQISKLLFNEKRVNEIYQLAQYMSALYPKHYFTYITAGMYYILVKKPIDAKRALFHSIQIDRSVGLSWLLLGYCQSSLCECTNAINCYEKAEIYMEESITASLGIALEYHRMCNYQKAEDKYTQILREYSIEECFIPYVSLLIAQKKYQEALDIVIQRKCVGEQALLKCCCYLFQSDILLAEKTLENIDMTTHSKSRSKYYLLKGYLLHLQKNHCAAIDLYQKAILDPSRTMGSLINDLLELAIKESLEGDKKQVAIQYKQDVFDYLFMELQTELVPVLI
ncbi:hypothetical protein NEFER03_1261 [Nematocida sp. LUAm3]|nr:hypothetical protein NEFER03_1261 [Nematocida sp. LUAm3]KAI5174117.1 hypothetical protein NEFER02_0584 [Nematocida sp. LUAm2]KAI5177140.1 hypothetical protein NEFER01_0415 [Nematocida sp. LUAm1]